MNDPIVTIAQAKAYLRIEADDADSDARLAPMVAAANEAVRTLCPGWDAATPVPATMTLAALMHVAHAFDDGAGDVPDTAVRLIHRYRAPEV